jgi:L-threonylcarbamoyladenylate synthase
MVSMAALVAGARAGKLVSFPTDTVPALAAIPTAAAEIFTLKQRSSDKPLILMAATLAELLEFADTSQTAVSVWREVAEQYFPGALTLVLPANERGCCLNPGFTTVGIRIPACPEAIAILQQTGALLTTSVNKSGETPLLSLSEIARQFPQVLTLEDCWGCDKTAITGSGQPSTVVEWTATGWQVRRQGQVHLPRLANLSG